MNDLTGVHDLTARMLQERIIAIFRGYTGKQADDAAAALVRGGIRFMEVTMNTEGATAIIGRWRKGFGTQAFIGAGTVLDADMAKDAIAAGAQYLITPNLDEEVIRVAADHGIEVWPGVITPTEMVRAWKAGAKALKLFPLGSLGPEYIQEIRGPLQQIPIIATGGIDLTNAERYWQAGASAFGLGSKLVRADYIRNGDYDELEQHARHWVELVRELS